MEKPGGFAGSVLHVDLSQGSITKEPLSQELMSNFLGGAGINTKLAYDLIKPAEDPLSPGNVLLIGAGPFVGTIIPGAGRCSATAKSPASGLFGSNISGYFGTLKFAGYDHLVIKGKADRPVYLKIRDDEVEIQDASHIWGKDTWEATDAIWKELGQEYEVLAIGPAGENLVRSANIVGGKYSAFARTGLGAVMGSKNLKAIAVYGTGSIEVADVEAFTQLLDRLYKEFTAQPGLDGWRTYGTLISLEAMAKAGLYPRKNFQEIGEADRCIEAFNLDDFAKLKVGDVACMSCPIGCKHFVELTEGKYAGLRLTVSCANAPTQSWGGPCGIEGWEEIFRCVELCNRLGLDYYDTAGLVAWAIELYQRGIIESKDTQGLELDWGKADVIQELIEKIAHKDGFGDILAQGLVEAPKRVGKSSSYYLAQVKGIGLVFDPRVRHSVEVVSQSFNVRGAHDSALSVTMLPRTRDKMVKFAERIGFPPADAWDRVLAGAEGFNAARLSKWYEDNVTVLDSLGMCQFAPFQRPNIALWAGLYSSLTGIQKDATELLKTGERAWNVRRAFNLREGATRKDDTFPERTIREPVKAGDKEYSPFTDAHLTKLIDDYYDERGWNADGTISQEKLDQLGLRL